PEPSRSLAGQKRSPWRSRRVLPSRYPNCPICQLAGGGKKIRTLAEDFRGNEPVVPSRSGQRRDLKREVRRPVALHRASVADNVCSEDRRQFALLTGDGKFSRSVPR